MTTKICETCGKEFKIRVSDVNRGRGRFCGKRCARMGNNNPAYKHGNASKSGFTKEYKTWAGIKRRTTSDRDQNSPYYFGRGIKMCDRWFNSFENFLADMGKAPSPSHSIDRIDNDGDYTPENCRWATRAEQMINMRSNRWLTLNEVTKTQEEWGRVTGLGGLTILKRLKRGWSVEKALTTPKLISTKKSHR